MGVVCHNTLDVDCDIFHTPQNRLVFQPSYTLFGNSTLYDHYRPTRPNPDAGRRYIRHSLFFQAPAKASSFSSS